MQSQLYELCGQFEQVFVAALVPQSIVDVGNARSDGDADLPVESSATAALFTQVFAAALERAGGLGLARELCRLLAEPGA